MTVMKTLFPGMDPYLEHHALWPDVHNSLIAAIRDAIVPRVAPNYYVRLESRAYVVRSDNPKDDLFLGRPDLAIVSPTLAWRVGEGVSTAVLAADDVGVQVLEASLPMPDEIDHYYLEVRSVQTHDLVTVIELLSPVNKLDARGREEYVEKRRQIIYSASNYVEIDLLRAGRPLPLSPQVQSDYRILVSRSWARPRTQLYVFNLPAPLPDIPLPLLPQDKERLIPLNDILHQTYTRARFDLQIDYSEPAVPPLTEAQAAWAADYLPKPSPKSEE